VLLMVSNAVRWEVALAAEPLSGSARVSLSAGTASTASTATAAARNAPGRRVTAASQRAPWVWRRPEDLSAAWAVRLASRAARDPGLGTSREPAMPKMAGSSVVAMRTAVRTVPAAANPITVRNGMPTTDKAASAMITVQPANTTAVPAVPAAMAADSAGESPAAS
jgi:hypothetical protein